MKQLKSFILLALFALHTFGLQAQNLLPSPFAYPSCGFAAPPTGYVTCVGSPDCAASRCTVPAGCSGQAVMCFGESFSYVLPTPLSIGQAYDISMSVSTGHLGAASIITGNHTFQIVGTSFVPPTCGSSSYGSICSVAGGQVLLTGTVNTIGWVFFQNTFTATSAISRITITNCDGTGNGGNIFCSPVLTSSILGPVEIEHFGGDFRDCQVDLEWTTSSTSPEISRFDVFRTGEKENRTLIGTVEAHSVSGAHTFRFTDPNPGQSGFYQLESVGLSGQKSQSQVVEIRENCSSRGLEIQSNPVSGNTARIFYNPSTSGGMLRILDMTGRQVYETTLEGNEGSGSLQVDLTGWKPGIYFISTSGGELKKMYLMK
ncbi:MAG: T9SS type A sorting domain-containing protein [Bacteroidia bacterium]|nr:T9SS type A sorting domain-containing protein [Bacteroidia bacterium]